MTVAIWLDLVVLVAAVLAALAGWRRGAIVGLLGFAGVVLGAVLGALLAGGVLHRVQPGWPRLTVVIAVVAIFLVTGELIGHRIGRSARDAVRGSGTRRADAVGGAVTHAAAVPVLVWLVAGTLAGSAQAQAVQGSVVLRTVADLAPGWAADLPERIAEPLRDAGLPAASAWPREETGRSREQPDPAVAALPLTAALEPSVLRIRDIAADCGLRQTGTGFVIAAQRVLTNAHVVAGATNISVDTADGPLDARVVQFEPAIDIAVLAVPGLTAVPVPIAPLPAEPGADAVVLGYPQGGPYTASAARVRSRVQRPVRDIYRTAGVERKFYAVAGEIRGGNSGGPLVDTEGRVLGVVFGVDEERGELGYASGLPDVLEQLGERWRAGTPVGAGNCAP
ncbi:MarP family serine protease [Nocardia sp. NPDC057227]|uniref:MarP family serine protease n=1 Tax=Nocardia sp. NPDC057227 TaxID=3346056 RepID=UPI00362BEAC3